MRNKITVYPNRDLFEKTRDIPKDQIQSQTYGQIGASMLEILKKSDGIGLSANQVGLPLNMCVIDLSNDVKMMLNPRIIKMSDKMVKSREGCLSLPGCSAILNRHDKVTVEYETVEGKTEQLEATGLLSKCIQHEVDHLKGVLIINRLSEYHKSKALKQIHKYKRFNRV